MTEPQQPHSKKYDQLIAAAEELFFKHGTKRVSVEEICANAGVSKMTFYRYFANKRDLAERIIQVMLAEAHAKLDETAALDVPFPAKLDILLAYKLEFMEKMSAEYVEEYIDMTDGAMVQAWIRHVMRFLKQAQQRGEIRADIRPEIILFIADKLADIVKDKRILQFYADYTDLTRDVWKMLYYGLLPRDDDGRAT